MTACTQPDCTGAIIDGYCDVCGSPAGAVPFVPAAASAAAPAPADAADLTTLGRESGAPQQASNGLMQACAQPGCVGMIIDGYCDVCGSPAGAVPFVPAAASAAAPAPADAADLTTLGRESGARQQASNGLMQACAQPGCVGMIIDGYCDVCGSPAGAVPFVPAAASAASPAPADAPDVSTLAARTRTPARVEEEMPTRPIPRVKMSSQQLSAHEIAKAGVVDRIAAEGIELAADIEDVNGDKELTEDQPDGVKGYRRRVEEAGLPDDVREATLREVGKLERTSDQSSECSDIRTWLDTILDLPWSTKTTDWMDLQGSREVEATLLGLIKPAAADTAKGELAAAETEQVDTEQVDTEQVDTALTGRQDDDTVELPPVVVVASGGRQPVPERPRQPSVDPAADTTEVDLAARDTGEADTKQADAEQVDAERRADTEQVDTEQVDTEQVDTEQVDTEQVDTEQVDTAPAGPHDGDTVELPIFAPPSGDEHPVPQLPESQERVQPAAAHIEKVETPIVDPAAADTKNAGAEDADAQKAAIADVDAPSNTVVADTEDAAVARAETDEADTATAVPEPMAVSPAAPAPVARPRRVRRGFVVAAVLLLLGCAVAVYLIAPGLLTHGSRPTAAVSPSEGSPPASAHHPPPVLVTVRRRVKLFS